MGTSAVEAFPESSESSRDVWNEPPCESIKHSDIHKLSVDLKTVSLSIVHRSNQYLGSLRWVSDLKEGMRMVSLSLTSLTEVEVVADNTLVAVTDDREHSTAIASYMWVGNFWLLGRLNLRSFSLDLRTADRTADFLSDFSRYLWDNLV